jgi:succinate dehydrogenase / fumarate reductase flavoprotein subunit
MEVGPTCHYVMGGIRVDPDTGQSRVPGLFAAGECAGGMHGSNRLGGNSLSDLLVFGRRAGLGAADYVVGLERRPAVRQADVDAAAELTLAPFDPPADAGDGVGGQAGQVGAENPYTLHAELQRMMNDLVGIIRTESEVAEAQRRLGELRARVGRVFVEGHRQYNPGWHLALDLRNMLMVSEAVAASALLRTESRGGHTREDHPGLDPEWRRRVLVTRRAGDGDPVIPRVVVEPAQRVPMRRDLLALFDLAELEKYYTDAELTAHPGYPADPPADPEGGTA